MFDLQAWMKENDVKSVERNEEELFVKITAHGNDNLHAWMRISYEDADLEEEIYNFIAHKMRKERRN